MELDVERLVRCGFYIRDFLYSHHNNPVPIEGIVYFRWICASYRSNSQCDCQAYAGSVARSTGRDKNTITNKIDTFGFSYGKPNANDAIFFSETETDPQSEPEQLKELQSSQYPNSNSMDSFTFANLPQNGLNNSMEYTVT